MVLATENGTHPHFSGVADALRSGSIDAVCNPDPVMHWLEQRGEIRLVAEARTPLGTQQVAGGPLPGGCLMAREEFLSLVGKR